MIVVNLFGAPGAGKSTGAAYIFSKLKAHGVNAELVTKDKIWEDNQEVFKNQAYIFGKQSFKMSRCKDKVDVIVTDSPLLLSAFYNEDPALGENFNQVVLDVFNSYDNLNFFIERVKPYNPSGRHQTEEEANKIECNLAKMLDKYNVDVTVDSGNGTGYQNIIDTVLLTLEDKAISGPVRFINKKAGKGRLTELVQLAVKTNGIILCKDLHERKNILNTMEQLASNTTLSAENKTNYLNVNILTYGTYVKYKKNCPEKVGDAPVLVYNPEKILKDLLVDAPIIALSSQLPADSEEG